MTWSNYHLKELPVFGRARGACDVEVCLCSGGFRAFGRPRLKCTGTVNTKRQALMKILVNQAFASFRCAGEVIC